MESLDNTLYKEIANLNRPIDPFNSNPINCKQATMYHYQGLFSIGTQNTFGIDKKGF